MLRFQAVRRIASLALTIGVLGALPGQSLSAQNGPVVRMGAFPFPVALDTLQRAFVTIGAPRDRALFAVNGVYESLKLTPELIDPPRGQIGVLRATLSRRLADKQLSSFFNCGRGMAGENADRWRLTIASVTYVEAKGADSSVVSTAIVGMAQDMYGSSTDPVMCGTTGLLETRIVELTQERMGLKPNQ